MQTQVFDRCASRYDSLVDTNWGAMSFTEGKCYVCGFVFVDLHSPFLEPVQGEVRVKVSVVRKAATFCMHSDPQSSGLSLSYYVYIPPP